MGTLSPIGAKAKSNTPSMPGAVDSANRGVVTAADGATHEATVQAVAAVNALVREYQRTATSREDQDPYAAIWRRAGIDQTSVPSASHASFAEPVLTFGVRRRNPRGTVAASQSESSGSLSQSQPPLRVEPHAVPHADASHGDTGDSRAPKQGQRVIFANPGEVVMASMGDLVYARPGAQIIGIGYALIELS